MMASINRQPDGISASGGMSGRMINMRPAVSNTSAAWSGFRTVS
jgi:hypothetical protein